MEIQVQQVEGKTNRKGLKQNQIFTIINETEVEGFFDAVNENGKHFTIWNCKGNWSMIGICRENKRSMSYTENFKIA